MKEKEFKKFYEDSWENTEWSDMMDNSPAPKHRRRLILNEAKKRVKAVKEEIAEAKEAIADAVEQVKDVVEAAQGSLIEGKVTKSKLNACKKSDLLKHADDEFGEKFDAKITKSSLVNKIYTLHKNR